VSTRIDWRASSSVTGSNSARTRSSRSSATSEMDGPDAGRRSRSRRVACRTPSRRRETVVHGADTRSRREAAARGLGTWRPGPHPTPNLAPRRRGTSVEANLSFDALPAAIERRVVHKPIVTRTLELPDVAVGQEDPADMSRYQRDLRGLGGYASVRRRSSRSDLGRRSCVVVIETTRTTDGPLQARRPRWGTRCAGQPGGTQHSKMAWRDKPLPQPRLRPVVPAGNRRP